MTSTQEILEQKAHLRVEALRQRTLIPHDHKDFEIFRDLFIEHIPLSSNQIVAGYWPKEREFDVSVLLDSLFEKGTSVVLPVVLENSKILKFALWDGNINHLVKGAFGVYHPVVNSDTQWLNPDIVIVPLLAFDRRGFRLGYGGGYYDATISSFRASGRQILCVGAAFAQQACLFPLPVDDHDMHLDWVVTPQKVYRF